MLNCFSKSLQSWNKEKKQQQLSFTFLQNRVTTYVHNQCHCHNSLTPSLFVEKCLNFCFESEYNSGSYVTILSQTDWINCSLTPFSCRLIAGSKSIANGHNNFGPAMVSNHCFPQCYCSIKYNDCHSFKSLLSWLLWRLLAWFRRERKFSWNILLTNLCTRTQKNLTIYVHEHEKPAAFLWLFHMLLWDLVAQ